MPGESIHMRDVVAAIEACPKPDVTFADDRPLPFPTSFPAVASMRR